MKNSYFASYLPPPEEVVNFLERYTSFYVLGHIEPDGDCLGSQIALGNFLQRKGSAVFLHSPGPFTRPEIGDLEALFSLRIETGSISAGSAAIILDCSTPDRIGGLYDAIAGLPLCVIDHHASGSTFGDVRWIEPGAPSVTFMIQQLIQSHDGNVQPDEARELFFGLATDTGFFRHLDIDGADGFRVAADLVDAGCSPKEAFARMYGNRPFSSRLLLARLLERTRPLAGGKILYTYETSADRLSLGPESRDSDILYQLLLGTRDCQLAVVIRNESDTTFSAGLRSIVDVDVGVIAKEFGGGGHAKAAGFSYVGKRSELESLLLPKLVATLKAGQL